MEHFEVIYSYSRQEAIQDGVLVDLSAKYPDIASQLYKYPVACTASLWGIVEKAVEKGGGNSFEGVIWDLLWMSQKGVVRRIDPTQHLFKVIIKGGGHRGAFTFKAVCGPGDDLKPVITLMLPEGD